MAKLRAQITMQRLRRFVVGAIRPTERRVGYACTAGVLLVMGIFVPLLNIPIILIAYPLIEFILTMSTVLIRAVRNNE